MSHHAIRSLALLLALLPLLGGGARPAAAQDTVAPSHVVGNTYTSPTYGYTLTWDDSWYVVDDTSRQGRDTLGMSNGSGHVLLFGEPGYAGHARPCVEATGRSLSHDKGTSNFTPLLDAAGTPVRGGNNTRFFAAYTLTYTSPDGTTGDLVNYLECRTLVPGEAVLLIVGVTRQETYAGQDPLVQTLLTGLVLPSPGEDGPVFISGPWRIAVVAAVRNAAIPAAGLKPKAGKDWLLVVVDVTDWGSNDAMLPVTGFGLRLAGGAKPIALAAKTTTAVARRLGIAPGDGAGGLAFTAGQTQRVVLVFRFPHAGTDPALVLASETLPLASAPALTALPSVTGPPAVQTAQVVGALDGGTLKVVLAGDQTPQRVVLLRLDAPVNTDCYAKKATAKIAKLAGTTIYLEREGGVPDRVLSRDVWVPQADGSKVLLNQELVAGGFAAVASGAPDGRFGTWLRAGEQAAQAKPAGLWSVCTGPHGQARAVTSPAARATPVASPVGQPAATPSS